MCDVMVALPDATAEGVTLFAKNSDRLAFDCQPLVQHASAEHPSGAPVELEYVTLPQVRTTYATLGFSPYWCWGYETGLNEHRVAAGNVAIITQELYREENRQERGLLGMDLLRLGLERGATAEEVMQVIADLAGRYGQWGSGVPGRSDAEGSYDNAFLIADPREAWLLELYGRRWAARRWTKGVVSLSNELQLTTEWDAGSGDLEDHAVAQGWWPAGRREGFNLAQAYSAHTRYVRAHAHLRVQRTRQLLEDQRGEITVSTLKRVLRDHYEDSFLGGPMFAATNPDFQTICMHESPSGFSCNTASSAIAALPADPDRFPCFWGSFGPPCVGVFNPFYLDATVPAEFGRAGTVGKIVHPPDTVARDEPTPDSPWWTFKALLEEVALDCHARTPLVRSAFDALERRRLAQVDQVERRATLWVKTDQREEAVSLLTSFMQRNVGETLELVGRLRERMREG
jgi:secernin